MRTLVEIVLLFALVAVAVAAMPEQATASTASAEELLVRSTYGKASFATRIGILVHSAILQSEGWPRIEHEAGLRSALDRQLSFTLTHFRVGKISDIGREPWLGLLTASSVPVIELRYENMPISMDTAVNNVIFAYGGARTRIRGRSNLA